jgi:hypothetical protein
LSDVFLIEEIRKSERLIVEKHIERHPFENE